MREHNKARGVRLKRFQLTKAEWELLNELHPLLNLFLDATKKISQNRVPLIHDVIPIVNILMTAMDDFIDNSSIHPTI
jgi:hypothetical protein